MKRTLVLIALLASSCGAQPSKAAGTDLVRAIRTSVKQSYREDLTTVLPKQTRRPVVYRNRLDRIGRFFQGKMTFAAIGRDLYVGRPNGKFTKRTAPTIEAAQNFDPLMTLMRQTNRGVLKVTRTTGGFTGTVHRVARATNDETVTVTVSGGRVTRFRIAMTVTPPKGPVRKQEISGTITYTTKVPMVEPPPSSSLLPQPTRRPVPTPTTTP